MVTLRPLSPIDQAVRFRPLPSQPAGRPLARPHSLAGANTDHDPAAVQRAARDLESVFLNLLWQEMWRTVGQGPVSFFPKGLAGDIYRSFFTQAYAERMAEAGGIGLAALVAEHVKRP